MKIRMVSLKPHRYAGKLHKAGDVVFANGKGDARLISALGWAEEQAEEPQPVKVEPRPVYQGWRKVIQPEVEVKPKRKYTRRDLTAENS